MRADKSGEYVSLVHTFDPVFDGRSRVLILGSFPSVKSREVAFYYGHPHNRFWKMLGGVFGCAVPETIDDKRAFLLERGIALWDVIKSCDIIGSSDASIKNVVPNDLSLILNSCKIEKILANGATSAKLYEKYCFDALQRKIIRMPSTSPANAACSLVNLIERYRDELFD